MIVMSAREWDDIRAERKTLQDRIGAAELELGGLRTINVQLHRDNSQLAHQLELVIVQLAVANDERVALLRARGVDVHNSPQYEVSRPTGEAPKAVTSAWVGRPLDDEVEEEKARTVAAMESSAAASLFDDPGDAAAAVLGRAHNELGEVEYLKGQ